MRGGLSISGGQALLLAVAFIFTVLELSDYEWQCQRDESAK
jgi:hypothetical protein